MREKERRNKRLQKRRKSREKEEGEKRERKKKREAENQTLFNTTQSICGYSLVYHNAQLFSLKYLN